MKKTHWKLRAVVFSLAVLVAPAFVLAGPPPCQNNADCNDGNACTSDVCLTDTGECLHVFNFGPLQCCDAATGMIVGFCEPDHDGCTLPQCLRTFPQRPCVPIDIEQIPCTSDGQCQTATNNVSPTCGQNNPGFCDCVCGNGLIDGAEDCDDGGETPTCDTDCTFVECGDGYVNSAAGETCDNLDPCFCGTCEFNCTIASVCTACPCTTLVDCRNTACPDDNACNQMVCDPVCHVCVYTCVVYGDIQPPGGNGVVNLDDILCVLSAFSLTACLDADIAPCGGNGVVNLDDILAVLDAFSGHNPCGCSENSAPGTGIAPLCGSASP